MKIVRCLSALLAAVACALFTPVARAEEKSVSFVTDAEKEGGFLLEITREAFKRVGYTVKVDFQPWPRALAAVMDGTSEALLGAQRTDERAAKMDYTNPIGHSDMVFFALKKNNIAFKGFDSLKQYSIGVTKGNNVSPEFEASGLKKDDSPDQLTNLKKLLAERVQLIIEKRAVVLDAVHTKFPESEGAVVALDPPIKTMHFHNAFSKKAANHELLASEFNKGLDLITKDGTLKGIMSKGLHE